MSKKAIGIPLATIILASGFGFATIDKASADAVTSKCANEWKAAKANGTTGGKGWKEFFDQCSADQLGVGRGLTISGDAAAPQPAASAATESATPAPAPAPAATAVATPAPAAATPTPPKRPDTKKEATATRQFATEADAKAKCPTGEVVWLNTATKKIQLPGHDGYGKGKKGAYMCEADASATGAHATKTEKQL